MTKKRKTQLLERLHILERTFNQHAYESTQESKQNFGEAYNALEMFGNLCSRYKWTCVASCPEEQDEMLCRLKGLFPEYSSMTKEELRTHPALSVVERVLSASEKLWCNRDTRRCSFEVLAGLVYSIRYVQIGEV